MRSPKAFVPLYYDPSLNVYKISLLQDFVYSGNYDLVCVRETWLNFTVLISEILSGYSIFRTDRACGKIGGRILKAVKDNLKAIRRADLERDNMKIAVVELVTDRKQMIFYIFYYPPDSKPESLLQQNSSLNRTGESGCLLVFVILTSHQSTGQRTDPPSPTNPGGIDELTVKFAIP